jgi:hypothetical protein
MSEELATEMSRKLVATAFVSILAVITVVVALGGPTAFWQQGCIEVEATTFIRQYAAGAKQSWFRTVFDSHANDIGTYQARELSYLVDLVDAVMHPTLGAAKGFTALVLAGLAASNVSLNKRRNVMAEGRWLALCTTSVSC